MENVPVKNQIAGILSILAGVGNGFLSFLMFLYMVWFCIGIWFVVPMAIAAVQIGYGIALIVGAKNPQMRFVPIIGIANAMLSCNLLAIVPVMLELGSLLLLQDPESVAYLSGPE